MSAMQPSASEPKPRKIACHRCGTVFGCCLDGGCWCAAEPFRLPLPSDAAATDCLCPDCLRALAATNR